MFPSTRFCLAPSVQILAGQVNWSLCTAISDFLRCECGCQLPQVYLTYGWKLWLIAVVYLVLTVKQNVIAVIIYYDNTIAWILPFFPHFLSSVYTAVKPTVVQDLLTPSFMSHMKLWWLRSVITISEWRRHISVYISVNMQTKPSIHHGRDPTWCKWSFGGC